MCMLAAQYDSLDEVILGACACGIVASPTTSCKHYFTLHNNGI